MTASLKVAGVIRRPAPEKDIAVNFDPISRVEEGSIDAIREMITVKIRSEKFCGPDCAIILVMKFIP